MLRRWALAAAAAVVLCSCTAPAPSVTLSVLASPELADLEPLLEELREDTGVRLRLRYEDTLAATRELAGAHDYDLAWLSTDRYLRIGLGGKPEGPRPQSTSTMTSPVVVGLTRAAAERLGDQLSWADLADAAAAGRFRFGMADPHQADSGLAALVGVASAAAATGGALRPEDVTCDRLSGFFSGHELSAPSSAELTARVPGRIGELDGVVDHESALVALNARLPEPLTLVYPTDGIVQSTYPLLLFEPSQQAAYDTVVAWLREPGVQQRIAETTARRPVTADVAAPPGLPPTTGTSLYFPDSPEVIEILLAHYSAEGVRPPEHTVFVLDYSGSMRGQRIAELRAAFAELTGTADASFVRFRVGERVTVLRFGGTVLAERAVTVTGQADVTALDELLTTESFADKTAVWTAVNRAYDLAAQSFERDPDRPVSVVLVTDGANNAGIPASAFIERFTARGPKVPLFAVRAGDADAAELSEVAAATGGRVVDAGGDRLTEALEVLRGCV
ncbi:vWA domain-containing protein [Actinokineospora sp. 24-640]